MEMETTTVIGLVGGGIALVSPALVWMKGENKRLQSVIESKDAQLAKQQETHVVDLKAHQTETRAVVTEVHEMVTALKRSPAVSSPPSPIDRSSVRREPFSGT